MVTVARAQSDLDAAKVAAAEVAARLREATAKKDAAVAQFGLTSPEAREARKEFNQANGANLEAQQVVIAEEQVFNSAEKISAQESKGVTSADPEATPTPAPQNSVSVAQIDPAPAPVDPAVDPDAGAGENPAVPASNIRTEPAIIGDEDAQQAAFQTFAAPGDEDAQQAPFGVFSSQNEVSSGVFQTKNQQTNKSLSQQPINTDWRVTLRLAPDATYLYKAADAGLLQPLKVTNGVVFPYTPAITTAYKANYAPYDLTHSNYRGYFYQNSYTDAVNLTATFTAQSTSDAAYMLAVIHFFRSVTKMFYGQDAQPQRGSPPPLVFLSGLGDYQFNNHPCLVTSFSYNLPADVDYISSGSPNNLGLNLQPLQNLYSTTLNAVSPTVTRLATAFLPPGAQNAIPAPLQGLLNNPTYVPSKIDLVISLLPVQSRQQVSKQFSLKGFANGQLLKGGFW